MLDNDMVKNKLAAGFALAADNGDAAPRGLGGDGRKLADADAGGTYRLQHQRQPCVAGLAGGADEVAVLLGGDLALLGAVGLVLDA